MCVCLWGINYHNITYLTHLAKFPPSKCENKLGTVGYFYFEIFINFITLALILLYIYVYIYISYFCKKTNIFIVINDSCLQGGVKNIQLTIGILVFSYLTSHFIFKNRYSKQFRFALFLLEVNRVPEDTIRVHLKVNIYLNVDSELTGIYQKTKLELFLNFNKYLRT